jgi:phage-related protein
MDAKENIFGKGGGNLDAFALQGGGNTAKRFKWKPPRLRFKELEVVARIFASGKGQVVVGEKGLAERVINLL